MTQYNAKYVANTSSKIVIAANNVMVEFKPFIDSFSVDLSMNFVEVKSFLEIVRKQTGQKERKVKISFNVPSYDVTEARSNHKKLHKLLRMSYPSSKDNKNTIVVKFANMLQRDKVDTSYSNYADFVKNSGVACKLSTISYQPDLDIGFFDENGMFFAKNFKLDLDLEIKAGAWPTYKKYKAGQLSPSDPKLLQPGSLFGYPIKYNDDK
jgi:hypothetical protein